jgi:tetratricopeptide (TPR) repeat protein
MLELSPDTASLTRASYAAELRGDIGRATELMQRALDDAPNASDRAFASFYLGELKFNAGDPNGALGDYNRAVEAAPNEPALLAGKAKAEAATGQVLTALGHYAEVVERAPDPSYVTAYGRLLESLGRDAEAQQQYRVVEATLALFAAEGVAPDAAPVLFEADHGDVDEALAQSEVGVEQRPFIAMYDARAWALHRAGRDVEALDAIERALELGTPYASYHYHAGMIHRALGNDDRALEELRRAMEINPTFDPIDAPIAAETIAALEAVS